MQLARHSAIGAVLGLAISAACSSAGGGGNEVNQSGGSSGSGGSAAAGGSGGSSAGGSGGSGGSSASGGTGTFDAGQKDSGMVDEDAACSVVEQKASTPAVDIIWAIDNSCSMGDEIEKVRAGLNDDFVPIIDQSPVDWKVLMFSKKGTGGREVCVAPPLAGANCADNPPRFLHINCAVNSNDALSVLTAAYPGPGGLGIFCPANWGNLIRYDATKVFVIVTDDEAEFPFYNGQQFDGFLMGANPPGMFGDPLNRRYVVHGIIGMDPNNPSQPCNTVMTLPDGGTTGNSAPAAGLEYQTLAQVTGGTVRSICEEDWTSIFQTIADGIVENLGCEYFVPAPGDGGTIDPDKVNVRYKPGDGSMERIIPRDDNAPCESGADGWQWTPGNQTLRLCGQTCLDVTNDNGAEINLEFGCKTQTVPPPE